MPTSTQPVHGKLIIPVDSIQVIKGPSLGRCIELAEEYRSPLLTQPMPASFTLKTAASAQPVVAKNARIIKLVAERRWYEDSDFLLREEKAIEWYKVLPLIEGSAPEKSRFFIAGWINTHLFSGSSRPVIVRWKYQGVYDAHTRTGTFLEVIS